MRKSYLYFVAWLITCNTHPAFDKDDYVYRIHKEQLHKETLPAVSVLVKGTN